MPPATVNTKKQLCTVIKKFKFNEFEDTVLSVFPEISWIEIRSKLVKDHHNFTTADAVKIIELEINKCHISDQDLKERLTELEALDISRHSKKKVWYSYELKGKKTPDKLIPNHDMQGRMSQIFSVLGINMNVKIINYQGITFVSMAQNTRSKRLLPVYFALSLRQGYFFCSRKNVTKDYLSSIVEGLGYERCKSMNLFGRDIRSLLRMIQMKKNGCTQRNTLNNSPVIKISQPIIKKTGIDFRQHKQRRKYLENCYGDDAPVLDALGVNASEVPWVDDNENLKDIKIKTAWEFKSHNIANHLLNLVEKRVIIDPIPNYILKLMETGKNQLAIAN